MTSNHSLVSWKPHSYQMTGVVLMISQACAGLLYKPGRGKTSVVYMAFRILQDKGFVNKVLVIAPLRPAYVVWPHQKDRYEEFQHFKVNILHGPNKEALLQDDSADIYVVNPEGLAWLFGATKNGTRGVTLDHKRLDYLRKKFGMLVVDESAKFRDTNTTRFKIIRQAVKSFKRRYILNGSPRPKSLENLFGQIYILDEGQSLGRYITHFRTEYFIPSNMGTYTEWTPQPGADKRIAEKIAPLVQVVERGSNEPELVFHDVWVKLPPEAMKKYLSMEAMLVADIEAGRIIAQNAAVASGKCRQICNGGLYTGEDGQWELIHNEKLSALEDLLEQIGGDPALISYEFKFDRERISNMWNERIPCISTGNMKHDTRMIQEFSRGEHMAVMGQSQSVAIGTDGLQDSCADIIMLGCPWDFYIYEQLIDRVRRQGSKAARVTVHRILALDTLDEKIISVLDSRDRSQTAFMDMLKKISRR